MLCVLTCKFYKKYPLFENSGYQFKLILVQERRYMYGDVITVLCNCIQRFYCIVYNVNFVLRNVMENKCITVPVTACGDSQTFDTVIHLLSEI